MPRAIEPDSDERSRTVPIRDSMTRIPGYPRKLVIFKIPASSYWWVRYYANFKTVKRTTKTEIKRDAMEAAKRFYDDVNIRFHKMGDIELPDDVNPAAVVKRDQLALIERFGGREAALKLGYPGETPTDQKFN